MTLSPSEETGLGSRKRHNSAGYFIKFHPRHITRARTAPTTTVLFDGLHSILSEP